MIENYIVWACFSTCLFNSTVQRAHLDMCTIGLTIYEYIITTGDEVATVWRRKLNISSVFLLSVRWTMVVNVLVYVLPSTAEVSSPYT
jgi:hypothetical protein